MKAIRQILILLLMAACQEDSTSSQIAQCLVTLDSIASNQTFREAVPVAEKMVKEHPQSSKLKLELGEFYLMTYLVDNSLEGRLSAIQQVEAAFGQDTTFQTTHTTFGRSPEFLQLFRQKWTAAFVKRNDELVDRMLIEALFDDFEFP